MRNVFYRLLGHLIKDIGNRFDKYVSRNNGLFPLLSPKETIAKVMIGHYQDDLPMPVDPGQELFQWKRRCESVSKSDRPSTIASSPRVCGFQTLKTCIPISVFY